MADYTKKTSDGYTVERLYKLDKYTVGAVIKRGTGNYLWAWCYYTELGKWGQGHYGYGTVNSAVESLKKAYPEATVLRADSIYYVVKESKDVYGVFGNLTDAKKFLYRIAKDRAPEPAFIIDAHGDNVCGAKFDKGKGYVIFSWLGRRTDNKLFRLLSTGDTRFIQWKE